MANRIVFELDRKGVAELLKSSGLEKALREEARKRCPSRSGYTTSTFKGANRVVAKIEADSPEAKRDNLANNTLLKVLGGR